MHAGTGLTIVSGITLFAAVSLAGCGKIKQVDPQQAAKVQAQAKRQQSACASPAAYDRLKGLVFDQAIDDHDGSRANLDTLADYSFARMEDPVVKGWDPALDITRCRGRFILEVPPGAERGLGGQRRLQADVDYTAQAAANGHGFVYQLDGAEQIVSRLAAFNLTSVAYRPSPAIDQRPGAIDGPERTAAIEPKAPEPSLDTGPIRSATIARQPSSPDDASERNDARPRRLPGSSHPSESGEATVRAFYDALGAGDGTMASARVVPEKRASSAFSPAAISRFYGRLPEPIRLTAITPLAGGAYHVRYRYSAGRSRCNGSAVVTLTNRGGANLIRSIRSLSGC